MVRTIMTGSYCPSRITADAPLGWIRRAEEFVAHAGLTRAGVEHVARHPQHVAEDRTQLDRTYLVERRTSGDITVVVGFENPARPVVMHVERCVSLVARRVSAPAGRVLGAPHTAKGLRGYLVGRGCRLELGGSGHYKVYRAGRYLGTVGSTPRPSSIADDFHRMRAVLDRLDAAGLQAAA